MDQKMIPDSLKWFERLALVSFITRGGLYLEHLQARQTIEVYDVIGVALGFLISAGLIFLTSRKGKRWAKWILIFVVVSTAMLFAGNIENAIKAGTITFAINVGHHFLMLVAMAFLFKPDAKNYLLAKSEKQLVQ
ncbi:MAG: hypothetical protein K8F90_00150 [Hyphomicrobiales bacterium]|nr:hypothetical protein [Hyphomicrobiales bacterium]